MSSIDDLSLISGISNISRISRANSSTHNKYDSTSNISEWRSMCHDINKSFSNDSRKVSELKINKAINICEESVCDYAKLKLIYECLKEICREDNNSIEKHVIKDLKNFITIHEVKKYIHLPNHSKDIKEELTLLGIIDLPKYEFSYRQQLNIKSCLEAKIRTKIHSFIVLYENLGGSTKEILKNNESKLRSRFQHKSELENMHWKDKIDEVCAEYKRDLNQSWKSLQYWTLLKKKMAGKNFEDAKSLLLQAETAEMKAKITKLTCTIRMYKETPVTIEAFKILNTTLNLKIDNIDEEIAEKKELQKSYEALNNTEYNEISRKYLELCHIIQKKKSLLDKL